ncbi:DUF4314 domain-containing protein [Micromonospora sp. DR5-3]|uniref:DUF4314 domain-containing protein n=1 Tax=unclassified Micromonospora TaxID=2617518 RepID=UPI0011D87786|nr:MULTISPECIES: DUF4314 domain-containing protein [unclassified Micromonospora]MCW3818591.1 DUF4314 domain-containing protein [Micromonospora sp. DR5-3]TYC20050.1 DUF4314 domain-containing protein [Micromonospora sp. MP36]
MTSSNNTRPAQPERAGRDPRSAADTYQVGNRVALEHTSDPHTRLRPGDEGTVRRYDADQRVLDVEWDSGSRLSMLLGEGDRVRRLRQAGWQRVLDALREAGAEAGRNAAEWWAQDTIGGRARGDVAATAREVLTEIEAATGRDIDGLPVSDRDDVASGRARYAEHAPPGAPEWEDLTGAQRDQARWAWCDGFDGTVEVGAARQCRIVLHPDGDDRDLRHVYPERVRLGGPGVFAGDWAWAPNGAGEMRIPVGFVGTLVDTWNGWAVFICTREVAEAIVADQQTARDRYRLQLAAEGVTGERLDRIVDESMGRLWFDGDVIVADETRVHDDPDAIERITPDADGRYVVMGRAWTWLPVHPYDCDRIAGHIPDPPSAA